LSTSLEFIKEQLAQAEKSFDSVYSKTLLIQSALSAGLGEFSSSVEEGVSSFKELAQAAVSGRQP
jgi:phage-related minor tail protein